MRTIPLPPMLLVGLLLFAAAVSPRSATAQPGLPPHVPGEVILKFKSNATEPEKEQVRQGLGGNHLKAFGRIKAELRKIGNMTVEEAIAQYRNHPRVEFIEPNYIVSLNETPNDPMFNQLYAMLNTGQTGGTAGADIRATNAWDVFTGSPSVLIGVIDTGVDHTHADLAANVWTNPGEIAGNGIDDDLNGYVDDVRGWDWVNNDNNAMDDHGHGSHVSGTIGAVGDNGIGVVGVCWNVKILPLKFLSSGGSGSIANAILAVEYATRMGVRLTSNSWGGGGYSQAMYNAIADANAHGILFVAAAGNNGANTDLSAHYPSSYDLPNVISVAATDHNDALASFSNYGATTVDLAAPGVNILSTFPGNNYGSISGTSMATPHVSGALGLVFGRLPGIGHLDAKSLILNFADPKPNLAGKMVTGGRLNAFMPIADPDSIPPAAIADLAAVNAGSNWLEIGWTATGDDDLTGDASRYRVRFSTAPIDAGNFELATPVPNPPDPGPAGTPQSMRINGLDFSTTYYVAVIALDEFGNASPISNVASGLTLGIPDIAASPSSFSETLLSGATVQRSLTLSNIGQGTLDYEIPTPQLITNSALMAEYVEIGKGEPDPRPGILGAGGPDAFGYRWADSDDAAGPAFNWMDISGTGTAVITAGDDVNVGPFPIGFTFPFYGVEYTSFRVCSNGWLSFTSTVTSYANQPLPNSGAPTALVAPFWDDLTLTVSGDVYYQLDGNRLIVQWNNIPLYDGGGPCTFQAILYSDGTIEYQYLTMGSVTNSGTIGIQNAPRTDGLQVVYNAAYLHDNMAIRIAAVPQWLTASPTSGTIYAPNSANIDVAVNSTGLLGGVYDGKVRILSNDPDESPFEVPVQLTVIGAPDIALGSTSVDFGQVFVGASPVEIVEVQNPGTDVLHVSSATVDTGPYTLNLGAFNVPPRSKVNLEVTFSPVAPGTYPATLTVVSDDPDEPSVTVALTGQGVPPPDFAVSPTELAANLLSDQIETQALTLTNTGGAVLEWSAAVNFQVASQLYTLTTPEVPSGPDADGGAPPVEIRSSPIQATLADLTGVDILWDRSNGQTTTTGWSTLVADVTARGATVTMSTAPITPALLAGYDVLWCIDTGSTASFDAAELAALTAWVSGGGGILLEGDNTSSVEMYNDLLAALNAGIVCSLDDNATGTSTNIHPHDTTVGVTGIYITAAVASIGSVVAPAGRLVDDINGRPNTAYSQVGAGRIVVAADELFQNSRMGTASNQLFGNQVLDWLAAPSFLRISPTAGTVAPGGSQVVDATFDATRLYGGLYQANVEIATNDPLAPEVVVPASMQVTGVPNLVMTPTSIDFGVVYVGYPELREFEVHNAGTDVLTISGVTSSDPQFSIFLGGNTFPIQLAPLATTVLQVRFEPSSVGTPSATLTVNTNDPDTPAALLAVSGNGLLPPVASVNPTSLHADLATGQTQIQQFVISNTGDSNLDWTAQLLFQVATQNYTLTPPEAPAGPDEEGGEAGPDSRTTPIQATLLDLTGVDILWDRSNGQTTTSSWTTLIADLTARGATVTQSTAPITPALLAGYDVLWIIDPGSTATFDADEIAAITPWVNAGGGILFEGDNTATVPIYNNLLAALGAGIVTSVDDNATGTTTNIHPHPTTEGVTGIYLTAATASIASVVAPGGRLVDDINGRPHAAFSQIGAGRIIVAMDEVFQNTRMSQASNQLWGNQVIDWLATPAFLTVDPAAGSIAAGGSATVDVEFDAGGLLTGDYASTIRVTSNDPVNGALDVAATLHVTGLPSLSLSATSLDFGNAFVGYPETMNLTLTNDGTGVLSVTSITSSLGDYTVDATSFTIDPFQSRNLQVTIVPTATGVRNATLTIASNDFLSPHLVSLSATGLMPPIVAANPTSLHENLLTGDAANRQLTLTNTGGSNLEWATQLRFETPVLNFTLTAPEAPVGPDADGGEVPADFRTTPIQASLADLTGIDILWDRSNGQSTTSSWTTLIADLTSRGATVTMSTDPITPALLSGYDVLWCIDTGSSASFDAAELAALTAWISAGGGILMEGDNTSSVEMYNDLLAALNAGIVCSLDDNATGTSTNIHPHATTEGVTGIYITAAVASIGSVVAPAGRLVDDINGRPNTAYSQVGAGRIVVAADELFQNSRMGTASNQLFGNQVFDWLATPVFLSVTPESGVIPAGGNAVLNVEFDAFGLFGGDYAGGIHVLSNDPLNPDLTVAATMHVTDAARIAFEPTSLDFGDAYIGFPETRTLKVKNTGTLPLTVSSVTPGTADWSVDASSFEVAPFASRDLAVAFDPQGTGPRNSSLVFASNDPYSPANVAVAGNGVVPPVITASPASLAGTALPGGSKVKSLTVCNTGGSDLNWVAGISSMSASYTLTAPATPVGPDVDGGEVPVDIRTTPIQATLGNLTGIDILWDRSNGQATTSGWSTLVADLTSRGATVTESTAPITPELLDGFDVMWCVDTGSSASFDAAELAALTAWVNSGGGILMEGDNTSSVEMYNDLLAALGAGIVCSLDDNATGTSTNIHPHQTTEGVTGIYITAAVASIGSVVAPAGRLVDDIDGLPNTAYSMVGAGRIIVAADELFQNSRMGTASNQLFGNQVFDWLATPAWLSVEPSSGVLPAGECATLTVTMDAAELEAGDYYAAVSLLSNDPATPELPVPVVFHVGSIAVADIDVNPDVINLGGQGSWITACIELPTGYAPEDIVLSTVRCNGVPASLQASTIGDFNFNGIPDRQFKFPLAQVAATFPEDQDTVEVTVLGEIEDTIFFVGAESLRVLHPRLRFPNGGEALAGGSTVEVQWTNPAGFENASASLEYSADDGATWTPVADRITGQSYAWQVPVEPTLAARMRVFVYQGGQKVLGLDTSDQSFSVGGIVTGIEDPVVPTEYALRFASANPATRGQVTLELALPEAGPVSLTVYDVRGGVVKDLVAEPRLDAGLHRIGWDGTNRGGSLASAGVYFVRATAGGRTFTTRFALVQ